MKEIKKILDFFQAHRESGLEMALATVVHVEDSSYRRIGARMLILENGHWVGGISGGCLEGDALLNAKKVMMNGECKVVTYDTRNRDARQIGVGLGCEGRIDVFIQPLRDQNSVIPVLEKCLRSRESGVVFTAFESTRPKDPLVGVSLFPMVSDHPFLRQLERELEEVKQQRRSKAVELKVEEHVLQVLLEYMEPNIHAVIVGDNYDVYPLLAIGRELGWEVSLVGKQHKLRKEGLENITRLVALEDIAGIVEDPYTTVLAMAHDYATDLAVLRHFASRRIGYLGMLGPRKRFKRMLGELGLDENAVRFVHNPMGLHIGAASPEEIAVSIAAEVIQAFRGGDGRSLKLKEGPIHKRDWQRG